MNENRSRLRRWKRKYNIKALFTESRRVFNCVFFRWWSWIQRRSNLRIHSGKPHFHFFELLAEGFVLNNINCRRWFKDIRGMIKILCALDRISDVIHTFRHGDLCSMMQTARLAVGSMWWLTPCAQSLLHDCDYIVVCTSFSGHK